MNKKILIVSILIGYIFASILYFKYQIENNTTETIYMIQVGAYKNFNNVTNIYKDTNKYLIEENDDLYHVYIGIVKNKENLDKLKVFLKEKNYNIYIRDKSINNSDYIKYLNTFDEILLGTDSENVIFNVLNQTIIKYKEMIL